MNKCPITYESCESRYSKKGLSMLSSRLNDLKDLPYSALQQRREAAKRATKISIQGVQPKLSARIDIKNQIFKIVDNNGDYIIKPQNDLFAELPENEDLTMKMAKSMGIEVPHTGLIYSQDHTLSYWIKRFDRYGRNKKRQQEDFAQLTQNSRDTKYNWSLEKLIPVIDQYCTFPMLEKKKLFNRVIFCFLTGNEDMHLKNFSLIIRNGKVELSPAYDLLNSTIAMDGTTEEMALTLAGKKSKISKDILLNYYAQSQLKLNEKLINQIMMGYTNKKDKLIQLIYASFLSSAMKQKYIDLMSKRYQRLGL